LLAHGLMLAKDLLINSELALLALPEFLVLDLFELLLPLLQVSSERLEDLELEDGVVLAS